MENFKASVQYSDLKGGIEIDQADLKGFRDFAKDNGIDTNRFFPVGISFYLGEGGFVGTTLITIDTVGNRIPGDYENIKDFIDQNDPVPVVKFDIDKDINEFFKYTKRVSIAFERRDLGLYGKDIVNQEV